MNEIDLCEVLFDFIEEINEGDKSKEVLTVQYADYIVDKFRQRILGLMMSD